MICARSVIVPAALAIAAPAASAASPEALWTWMQCKGSDQQQTEFVSRPFAVAPGLPGAEKAFAPEDNTPTDFVERLEWTEAVNKEFSAAVVAQYGASFSAAVAAETAIGCGEAPEANGAYETEDDALQWRETRLNVLAGVMATLGIPFQWREVSFAPED